MAGIGKNWARLDMSDHTQLKVVHSELHFIRDYLDEKILRHWFIPSKDIDDQRLVQSDWTKAVYNLKLHQLTWAKNFIQNRSFWVIFNQSIPSKPTKKKTHGKSGQNIES